jgi:hypothetical protein
MNVPPIQLVHVDSIVLCDNCRDDHHQDHTSKVHLPRDQRGQHQSKRGRTVGHDFKGKRRIVTCSCAECVQPAGWRGTPQPVPRMKW